MPPFRPPAPRRRPRPGSLERPVNARAYRGTALLVAIPLLITAFTISRPESLPPPTFPPAFDEVGATQTAREFATLFSDRTPGTPRARLAGDWVAERLRSFGFRVQRDRFEARLPGLGRTELENIVAVSPGRSPEVLVAMAHRDNLGTGQGANDNASGTGALLELARGYGLRAAPVPGAGPAPRPTRTIVFLSTDGGGFGGLGAARFLQASPYRARIAAAVNLDSIGGRGQIRVELAGDRPRSPDATLVETASARIRQAGAQPTHISAAGQIIDLAFPFSLYEQAPFVGEGIPAVTLTTAGVRPPDPLTDTLEQLSDRRIGQTGRAAEGLLGSLDEGVALAGDRSSYLYLGPRVVPGWAVQLVLITALLPFLLATVDLFARCRRRRIPLAPALRSYRSRLGFWLWVGLVFALFGLLGAWSEGQARPAPPAMETSGDWPMIALGFFAVIVFASWLVGRERLLPRRSVSAEEELAGQTTALLVLGVLALLVTAINAFALVFLLPSLHAWLWLPHVREARVWVRTAVLAAGFSGPALLLGSFAWRYHLGFDSPWYVVQLIAIGYIPVVAVAIGLAWLASAGQLTAIAAGRYAPYPSARERPPRGPIRQLIGRLLAFALNLRTERELKRAVGS